MGRSGEAANRQEILLPGEKTVCFIAIHMGRFGEAANRLEILLAGGKLSVSVGYIWVGAERQQTDWKFYWLGGENKSVSMRYIWVGAERQQTDWKLLWHILSPGIYCLPGDKICCNRNTTG